MGILEGISGCSRAASLAVGQLGRENDKILTFKCRDGICGRVRLTLEAKPLAFIQK